jgi:hypothetical protein
MKRSRLGRDHMVVEFTTSYAYHYWCCEFESRSGRGVQHYVITPTSEHFHMILFVCLMVLNATFNNISAISWRSVLLVDETKNMARWRLQCLAYLKIAYLWNKLDFYFISNVSKMPLMLLLELWTLLWDHTISGWPNEWINITWQCFIKSDSR